MLSFQNIFLASKNSLVFVSSFPRAILNSVLHFLLPLSLYSFILTYSSFSSCLLPNFWLTNFLPWQFSFLLKTFLHSGSYFLHFKVYCLLSLHFGSSVLLYASVFFFMAPTAQRSLIKLFPFLHAIFLSLLRVFLSPTFQSTSHIMNIHFSCSLPHDLPHFLPFPLSSSNVSLLTSSLSPRMSPPHSSGFLTLCIYFIPILHLII